MKIRGGALRDHPAKTMGMPVPTDFENFLNQASNMAVVPPIGATPAFLENLLNHQY